MKSIFSSVAAKSILGATVALSAAWATPSQAATVLTGFSTNGADMAGMDVTATFLGGGSQKVGWSTTGADSGAASGSGWSLSQSGDTFSNPWTLQSTGASIVSLLINAIPGNTVFDNGSSPSTPGSAAGISFSSISGDGPDSFSYGVPIDISTGDLFGTLTLNWATPFTTSLTYQADTDSGSDSNPVVPMQDVPTPALLPGLIGMGVAALRKRKGEETGKAA